MISTTIAHNTDSTDLEDTVIEADVPDAHESNPTVYTPWQIVKGKTIEEIFAIIVKNERDPAHHTLTPEGIRQFRMRLWNICERGAEDRYVQAEREKAHVMLHALHPKRQEAFGTEILNNAE